MQFFCFSLFFHFLYRAVYASYSSVDIYIWCIFTTAGNNLSADRSAIIVLWHLFCNRQIIDCTNPEALCAAESMKYSIVCLLLCQVMNNGHQWWLSTPSPASATMHLIYWRFGLTCAAVYVAALLSPGTWIITPIIIIVMIMVIILRCFSRILGSQGRSQRGGGQETMPPNRRLGGFFNEKTGFVVT